MKREIRVASTRDAEQIAGIYAPFCEDSPVSFEIAAPTVEQMAARITSVTERYPWLVCADLENQTVVGYVYASRHREREAYKWSVDVTAYLAAPSRGKGLGKTLYQALFDLLKLQGYYNAYAGITLPNGASVALHTSLGFQPVGVYRHVGYKASGWRDVSWWALELRAAREAPTDPRPLHEVLTTPEAVAILAEATRQAQLLPL